MLAETAHLRGTVEESAEILTRIEAARRQLSQLGDDLQYMCEVLKQRTDLQRAALQLLEAELVASRDQSA
jgi:hypothetical protein